MPGNISRVEVSAMERFRGTIKDQRAGTSNDVDSAKIHIFVKLDSRRNGSRNGSESFKFGKVTALLPGATPEMVRRLEHIPTPFMAEVDMDMVSDGKGGFRPSLANIVPIVDQQLVQGASPVVSVQTARHPTSPPSVRAAG